MSLYSQIDLLASGTSGRTIGLVEEKGLGALNIQWQEDSCEYESERVRHKENSLAYLFIRGCGRGVQKRLRMGKRRSERSSLYTQSSTGVIILQRTKQESTWSVRSLG